MPQIWQQPNTMPTQLEWDNAVQNLAENGNNAVGAYFKDNNTWMISNHADLRNPYWFGIASHEFAHSAGADEKEAQRVQKVCEDQKYNE
jgi:hypothetical protein